ncbi:PEPxxWA-CTERM sorting domain-containing protein [Phenylobacterium sp.]
MGARSKLNLTLGDANGGVLEPATWAMMLVGFGGLGAALRRRRVGIINA